MSSPPDAPAEQSPGGSQGTDEDRASLEARNLVRTFGPVRAVDGVTFRVEVGELLTIFGPNGAGKSTLLNLLAGAMRPTAGEIRMGGRLRSHGEVEWRRGVGILSHQTFLYDPLTAAENLRFYGRLFGVPSLDDRIQERLEAVGLASRRDDPVRGFSRGMRQRLALARTLLHDPEVVLLDEPYTGLDVHAAALLRDLLSSLKDGRRTVVLVTHDLTQGMELADRVAIQVAGRFAFHDAVEGLPEGPMDSFYRDVVEGALGGGGSGGIAAAERTGPR